MARNDTPRWPNCEIYVGNILISVTESDLRNTFNDYTVKNVKIISTGTKKYAFLQLDSEASVTRAVKEMNNHALKGSKMVVRAGNPKLQANILKGMVSPESSNRSAHLNGTVDDGPPPLEAVYASADDLPPPLEPAFVNGSRLKLFQEDKSPVTLVVANFPFGTNEDDILFLFQDYMPLKASVIVNSKLRNPDEKTYAYLTVPDWALAERAVNKLDDTMFGRRRLIVTYMLEKATVR